MYLQAVIQDASNKVSFSNFRKLNIVFYAKNQPIAMVITEVNPTCF